MIIYDKIFFQIIEPFRCLWDNDEMGDQVLDYENKGDFNGLTDFIQKTIEEHLIDHIGNDYLKSINIKTTIFYFIKCCPIERLDSKLAADLISFKDISVFINALDNILQKMINSTGDISIACDEIIENDQPLENTDIFDQYDDWLNYMKE